MKKLLLFTGIAYGLYKIFEYFNSGNTEHKLATERSGTKNDAEDKGRTIRNTKAKAHHGDIRGFMKKAGSISHHQEEASSI